MPPLLEVFDFDDPGFLLGLCDEDFCCRGEPPDRGGVLRPGLVGAVLVVVGAGVFEVVVGGAGVVDTGAHDIETPTTPTFTGSEIADSGVPGGTFTVNERCPPPTTVTVITHESAEAVGAISAIEATAAETVATNAAAATRIRPTLNATRHLSL